jgi:anaerobic magnesium-protoporphyrin IX monomethyl ester cyclase
MSDRCFLFAYPKVDLGTSYPCTWAPYSVLFPASLLRQNGFEVGIFDENVDPPESLKEMLEQYSDSLSFFGVSMMTGGGQISSGLGLISLSKKLKPDLPVLVGGPHATVLPQETLAHPQIDCVISGSGLPLMRRIIDYPDQDIMSLSCIGFRAKDGKECSKSDHGSIEPLPRLDWQLIELEKYVHNDPFLGARTFAYISTVGCVHNCAFCFERTRGSFIAHPLRYILSDLNQLITSLGLTGIKFYDADFLFSPKRAIAFAQRFFTDHGTIQWSASASPRDILDGMKYQKDYLKTLRRSGCQRLLLGLESGSERILKEIAEKNFSSTEAIEAASMIAAEGITACFTFMLGFPSETESEIQETFALGERLRRLSPEPELRFHLYAPYPGTRLYGASVRSGFVPPSDLIGWSNFDYYSATTPWVSAEIARRALESTSLRFSSWQEGS